MPRLPTLGTSRYISTLLNRLTTLEGCLPYYLDALDDAPTDETRAQAASALCRVLQRYLMWTRPQTRLLLDVLDPGSNTHAQLQRFLTVIDRMLRRWLENYP